MKERIRYIDHLKGVAIFLVAVGHFIQYNTFESKDNALFSVIYSFHMPLFMFISGYVAFLTIKTKIFGSYFQFLLNKARALLLPFFVWPLIVDNFFFSNKLEFGFSGTVQTLLADPRTGLWFLWYLFFLSILYSFFLFFAGRFNKDNKLVVDILICASVLMIIVLLRFMKVAVYIDSFMQYYLYFFIGVFLSKYMVLKAIVLDNRFFSFSLIAFLVLVGHYSFNDKNFHNLGLSLLIKIVAAACAICAIYYIVIKTTWHPLVDKYITDWGKYSIVVYATHFKFIAILKGICLLPPMNVFLLILVSSFFATLIIFFCLLIFKVVQLSPPLNLLLYGVRINEDRRQKDIQS